MKMHKLAIVLIFTIVCSALIDQSRQENRPSTNRNLNRQIKAIVEKEPELQQMVDQLNGDEKALRDLIKYAALTKDQRKTFDENGGVFPDEDENGNKKTNRIRNAVMFMAKLGGMVTFGSVLAGSVLAGGDFGGLFKNAVLMG